MDDLKGWWDEKEAVDCTNQNVLSHQINHHRPLSPSFSALAKLLIINCKNLAYFPLYPNVEELFLRNINKSLIMSLTTSVLSGDAGSSVTFSEHKSKLNTLSIDEIEVLSSLPEESLGHIKALDIQDSKLLNSSRLEEVFKRLSSLSLLIFSQCTTLESISEGLEHLTSLDRLVIQACFRLDLSQNERLDGMPWKALNSSVHTLHLDCNPKLLHLPCGLQHLTNLRSLMLTNLGNLVELPQWISSFSCLEYLLLCACPQLTYLPEEFGKLATLNVLEIKGCDGLTMRCRGPAGSEWPKIQHIPLRTYCQREAIR